MDLLTYLAEAGFLIRNQLGELTTLSGLRLILQHKHYELYRFLWGSIDMLNFWTNESFQALTEVIAAEHQNLLDFHLNAGACLFLAQP